MPINEQLMALGDWSVTLRPDTPLSVRDRISVPFSHIVITNSWVDVSNAGLDDDAVLSAARYTGVALRPGPQLTLGGQGLLWWLGDADNQPWARAMGSQNSVSWALAYDLPIFERFNAGAIASGGSFTTPVQFYVSRRDRLNQVALAAGHEWRINPDLTFDADTVANLYGTPTVVLVDGSPARGPGLVGLEATFAVEEDWEQWGSFLQIFTPTGSTQDSVVVAGSPSTTPIGELHSRELGADVPDVPRGYEQTVANQMITELSEPRYEVAVTVTDGSLVDHVRCGDSVYVYDESQGLRDSSNQVEHGGRTIWPKTMRVTRMSWPVKQGMGVYWRTWETGDGAPYYTDLTPYVQWEDGDGTLDIIQGDDARYSLNPATGRADQIAAAAERVLTEPWVTYVPTWGATGGAPTLGNATLVGAYRRQGTTLHFSGMLTYGSSSSPGTGGWIFTLPPGCTTVSDRRQSASGMARDVSGALAFSVNGDVAASSTSMLFGSDRHSSGSGFYTGDGTPFTWQTGDTLAWNGTIEIAP
jgi:hypothetical protein